MLLADSSSLSPYSSTMWDSRNTSVVSIYVFLEGNKYKSIRVAEIAGESIQACKYTRSSPSLKKL